VATIHAAHSVYQSMEKREARRKALKEGEISPEQAKREKNKNRLQDVASVGIAALGMKGAYSEWREMGETRKEIREQKEKNERHRAKREARRRKMSMLAADNYVGSGYAGSMPNLGTYPHDPYRPTGVPYSTASSFHYADDNPYGALTQPPAYVPSPSVPYGNFPPPPMGVPPPQMGVPRSETR